MYDNTKDLSVHTTRATNEPRNQKYSISVPNTVPHTRREHAAGKQATQPSSTWQQRCHEESNTQRFYNEIFMNQESCYVTNILDALAEGSCLGRSKGWKVA